MSALHDAGGALAGLLDSIDDAKLRQVIRLVEASGQRRTLEPALADLRPRLRQLRPQRPLTVARLLTIPFAPALDDGGDAPSSFTIARERLGHWQKLVQERLGPPILDAIRATIAGHSADDEAAILAAGRLCWPQAARALLAESVPHETDLLAAERQRIADLLAIAERLVPWLGRLRPPLVMHDEADRATVSAVLALATPGPADRLGVLAALLLRRTSRLGAAAQWLVDLAPRALRCRFEPLLQRLMVEQRAHLARRIDGLGASPALPLAAVIDELVRLGSIARSLAPESTIQALTGATIERLVNLEARRRGGRRTLVTVDDARLIEILAGPDLAWRYLRPEAAAGPASRQTAPDAAPMAMCIATAGRQPTSD